MNVNVRTFAFNHCPSLLKPTLNGIAWSPLRLRLAKGVFWSIAGTIISRGLTLFATIAIARFLGRSSYGELGIVQSTVGMLGVFAGMGLGLTSTKYVAEFRCRAPQRAGQIIGLSSVVAMTTGGLASLGLYAFAPWFAERAINAPHLADVLRVAALLPLFSAMNGAQTGALAGFEAFKSIARVNVATGLASFPILIGGAYFGGLNGAVWAVALSLATNCLLNHLALRRQAARSGVPLTLRGCQRELPALWRFSLPAVLAGSMTGPVNWLCAALLVNRPGGYDEMAILNASNQWFLLVLFLPTVLASVILPMLSDQVGHTGARESIRVLVFAVKVNLIIVAPVIAIACVASPQIMSLYGEDFQSGWATLLIVLLTAGILAVQTPLAQIIVASGRMWSVVAMNAGWALVFVAGTVWLIDSGSLGLVCARGIAYAVYSVLFFGTVFCLLRAKESA